MAEQSETPETREEFFGSFGIAAYAMMTGLLTSLAQGNDRDLARLVVEHAKTWLEERSDKSASFRFARHRMDAVDKVIGLLATEPAGTKQ